MFGRATIRLGIGPHSSFTVIYSNNSSSDYFYYKDTRLYRSETESVSFACIANDPNTHMPLVETVGLQPNIGILNKAVDDSRLRPRYHLASCGEFVFDAFGYFQPVKRA